MSKIVAVSCAPSHSGSSSDIMDAFLDGAMGLSTNLVTLHRPVKFKSIQDCRRCMGCKGSGRCIVDDEIRTVLDDVKDSDCVVFSTPLYFDGPTALYKMIEDRMYSFLDTNRRSILKKGKKAVLIITSSYPQSDLDAVAKRLSHNLETIGFEMLGVFTYCDNLGENPVNGDSEIIKKAKQLGKTMRNTPVV